MNAQVKGLITNVVIAIAAIAFCFFVAAQVAQYQQAEWNEAVHNMKSF